MAEEEILQQAAPAKKKSAGGGFSFVHIVIIVVVLGVVMIAGMMFLDKSLSGNLGTIGRDVKDSKSNMYVQGVVKVPYRIKFKDCKIIMPLTDQPMIVNLADGTSYLSAKISVCLDKDFKPEDYKSMGDYKTVEDAFTANKDKVLYACNEYLSTLTKAQLFPAGGGAVKPAEGEGGFNLSDTGEAPSFSKRMDETRGQLLDTIQKRGLNFIADVYFTAFVVQ